MGWFRRDKGGDEGSGSTAPGEAVTDAQVSSVTPAVHLVDRFVDRGEIARGGMGAIHRVYDKNLLRFSAMKVLAPELLRDASHAQRFLEEAQITGQLDHPNVVPIHELGVDEEGLLYFTMKLVQGETLEQQLQSIDGVRRTFDLVQPFLESFLKVCDAVAFAHSRGVLHRDLKPANIMIGEFGQVYVMDWGVARLVGRGAVEVSRPVEEDLDREGMVLGSPSFMSPEQARGENQTLDARSDVFSLGAILYAVLTGQPPHRATEMTQKILLAQAGIIMPVELQPLGRELPRAVGAIAMKAMAKDPAQRYPSVLALKDDVLRLLRGGVDMPRRTYPAGSLVFAEGEGADEAFIIEQGSAHVFRNIEGHKRVLRVMGPGAVFGETAILSARKVRSASVEAVTPLTLKVVTAETLTEGVGMNGWLGAFVTALADRFVEADDRLAVIEGMMMQSLDGGSKSS